MLLPKIAAIQPSTDLRCSVANKVLLGISNLDVSNPVVGLRRSFAPFLRSFALFCTRSFALFCPLLRSFALFLRPIALRTTVFGNSDSAQARPREGVDPLRIYVRELETRFCDLILTVHYIM